MAPQEAMQFGKAPQRILQAIVDANPSHGPVHLMKVDIADGFYQIWINLHDIPKLTKTRLSSIDYNCFGCYLLVCKISHI
jgi:hypothetical protein